MNTNEKMSGHDATNVQAYGIMAFALKYDVPVPLELFKLVISRSAAFKARADGKLHLEEVASRAAIRPSELARYLNRNKSSSVSVFPDHAA